MPPIHDVVGSGKWADAHCTAGFASSIRHLLKINRCPKSTMLHLVCGACYFIMGSRNLRRAFRISGPHIQHMKLLYPFLHRCFCSTLAMPKFVAEFKPSILLIISWQQLLFSRSCLHVSIMICVFLQFDLHLSCQRTIKE